jgi:hypothetical protein
MRLKVSLKDGTSKLIILEKVDVIPTPKRVSNTPLPVILNLNGFENKSRLVFSSSIAPDALSIDKIEIIE